MAARCALIVSTLSVVITEFDLLSPLVLTLAYQVSSFHHAKQKTTKAGYSVSRVSQPWLT